MISNAFKSAYINEQSAINETGNNVANAVKGAGTLIAGIAAFTGALGDGTVATAAKHNLAGKIGGIGGNIMLASIDEKRAVAQSQQIQNLAKLSEDKNNAERQILTLNQTRNEHMSNIAELTDEIERCNIKLNEMERNIKDKGDSNEKILKEIDAQR